MSVTYDLAVRMIPVRLITVLNPRDRGKKKFAQITQNIAKIGLKKPVIAALADSKNGEPRYWLVCGQGRYEAFLELGQDEIPAIFVTGTMEELHLLSLAENLARRRHSAVELLGEVRRLKDRGHSHAEIARKTDLDVAYVRGILQLLASGEDRLLQAVEKGQVPMGVAVMIATTDDKQVQRSLQDAYEQNDLRGKAFVRAKRLVETRRARGKRPRGGPRKRATRPTSTDALLRTFQQETLRQRMTVQKAKVCEARLLFAVAALRQLFRDDHFVTLLRAEGLDSLPQFLAEQIFDAGDTP